MSQIHRLNACVTLVKCSASPRLCGLRRPAEGLRARLPQPSRSSSTRSPHGRLRPTGRPGTSEPPRPCPSLGRGGGAVTPSRFAGMKRGGGDVLGTQLGRSVGLGGGGLLTSRPSSQVHGQRPRAPGAGVRLRAMPVPLNCICRAETPLGPPLGSHAQGAGLGAATARWGESVAEHSEITLQMCLVHTLSSQSVHVPAPPACGDKSGPLPMPVLTPRSPAACSPSW